MLSSREHGSPETAAPRAAEAHDVSTRAPNSDLGAKVRTGGRSRDASLGATPPAEGLRGPETTSRSDVDVDHFLRPRFLLDSTSAPRREFPETASEASARLDPFLVRRFSPLLGRDLSDVRIHTESARAHSAGARAFTSASDIVFAPGEYRPFTTAGDKLLAHELAHVAQQGLSSRTSPDEGAPREHALRSATARSRTGRDPLEQNADESAERMLRGEAAAIVAPLGTTAVSVQCDVSREGPPVAVSSYTVDGARFQVGMAAGPNVLVGIETYPGGEVSFSWVNFRTNEAHTGTPREWAFLVGAAIIGMNDDGFGGAGALSAAELRGLTANPSKGILAAHEAGRVNLPERAVLSAYGGLIASEALNSLATNEKAIDALLNQPDRVQKLEEYALDLKEASFVRDKLEARRDELKRSTPGQHSFSFGLPKTVGAVVDPYQLMQVAKELHEVEGSLAFWYASFPLLTRISTGELRGTRVEAELRQIKANITSVRAEVMQARVGDGPLNLWDLDNVRAGLQDSLGNKTKSVIEAEEKSRRRWGWVKSGAMVAGSIGLLFLPGGIFIDAAIGFALAGKAWADAAHIGRVANTAMHADEGLMSQARVVGANVEAVFATIFAVVGGAAAGLRILKAGRTFVTVSRAAPELELASQIRLTRLLMARPGLFKTALTLAEAEAEMQRLGVRLGFAELQGLRAAIFRRLGQTMPAQSTESLAQFLDVVWSRRASLRSADDIYRIYSAAREANVLKRAASDYMDKLTKLGRGRKGLSNLQGNPLRGFWRFEREGVDIVKQTTERIYLNVTADHAPEVMEMIVKDIVDNAAMKGVTMAKISGPEAIAGRADGIVLYLEDEAASRAALARIRAYQAANPSHFNRTTPFMTNQVMEGVSVGSEPLGSLGQVSFGGVRSDAVWAALEESLAKGGSREDFLRLVVQRFRSARIDPGAPHLNLPVAGP